MAERADFVSLVTGVLGMGVTGAYASAAHGGAQRPENVARSRKKKEKNHTRCVNRVCAIRLFSSLRTFGRTTKEGGENSAICLVIIYSICGLLKKHCTSRGIRNSSPHGRRFRAKRTNVLQCEIKAYRRASRRLLQL